MKNILIVGSSGMIGGIILRECLQSDEVGKVISLVRKQSGIKHEKLVERIHADYSDYAAVSSLFHKVDVAFFCIGVYTGQVKDTEFKKITVDFAKSFADFLIKYSPDATLCFLSGQGADLKEKSRMSFARYKGMAENYLMKKGFQALYIFRPAYIYPVNPRKEPNFSYRMMRALYPLMKKLAPSTAITSETLGKAMFNAGLHGAEKMTLENQDIKSIV